MPWNGLAKLKMTTLPGRLKEWSRGLGQDCHSPMKKGLKQRRNPLICLAPQVSRLTNCSKIAEPEVWFRIIHVIHEDNSDFSTHHEQTVEIVLGPKGAFEDGNVGTIKRRVPPNGVVNAVPPRLLKPRRQKIPKTPRVAELLRKAMEWKELIESGKGVTQADIARREGLSRARVTQIMDLLNLAPDIQKYILSMPRVTKRPVVTERSLRPIVKVANLLEQVERLVQRLRP